MVRGAKNKEWCEYKKTKLVEKGGVNTVVRGTKNTQKTKWVEKGEM
jgi:hypothetical protein